MNSEILGVILQWAALVILCYPLGRYIAKVYKGERTWLDFMAPVERFVYRICGIDPMQEMNWKQFLKALLTVNLFWFFWGMLLLVCQGWLPLNPDGNPGQSPDLAFNTCISFMVNCNLQHYSGESGLSYFTQLFVIMLFQFVTAACGMAAMAGVMKALAAKTTKTIGNFWVFLTKSVTRILMPLSLAVGILLIINGTLMSFDGRQTLTTLEGGEQVISQGPAAAIVPIKQLGTNGGGYFGTNSAHPLENPNAFTNILECWSILILPMAMVWAFGFYIRRRRLAAWIFGVMLFAYTAGVIFSVWQETGGSRQIEQMGISQKLGSMEGKEIPDSGRHRNLRGHSRRKSRNRMAEQPVVPRPERNALRIHLLGGQQRFGLRRTGRQYAVLEHFDRHRTDHGPLFPDRGTGGRRRTAGFEEVHSRKRRYAQDRHGNLLADDLRRHHHRRRTLVLPVTGARTDRRLPDLLKTQ